MAIEYCKTCEVYTDRCNHDDHDVVEFDEAALVVHNVMGRLERQVLLEIAGDLPASQWSDAIEESTAFMTKFSVLQELAITPFGLSVLHIVRSLRG